MRIDYAELLSSADMFEAFKRSTIKDRSETLQVVYHSLKKCLVEKGYFDEKLHASLFIALCEALGGAQIYLPGPRHLFKILDEILIHKEFTGKNQDELALKYKLSRKTIGIILERQRKFQKLARDHIEGIGIKHA